MSQKSSKSNIIEVGVENVSDLYKNAICALNQLQSNFNVLKNIKQMGNLYQKNGSETNKLQRFYKFFLRSGMNIKEMDNLSVIHVTGTKGKGSTCAYCESILRHYGYRTGFFSSPHLISVRERIRLDGKPIQKSLFENDTDMPSYFQFLTILAFNIFLKEKIDVAIIEVGIGGEYDCTNILRKVSIVGITSIGLDHTFMLGDTVEKIAWQKAGIMKNGCEAFTVEQADNIYQVLNERSVEKSCYLQVAPSFNSYKFNSYCEELDRLNEIQKINASLAIQLSYAWMRINPTQVLSNITADGIVKCRWPGRTQILDQSMARFFLDGAHTVESITFCIQWFIDKTKDSKSEKMLVFNVTGYRKGGDLLHILSKCQFDQVFFVPNASHSTVDSSSDQANLKNPVNDQLKYCEINRNLWLDICKNSTSQTNTTKVHVLPSVSHILEILTKKDKSNHPNVLVTGSLHLVGAVLNLIDPNLELSELS